MSIAPTKASHRVVFVTGPSGAGRSSAIKVLEDLGFETIDNLPLRWVVPLLTGQKLTRPIALCLDTRNRDFTPQALLDVLDNLRHLDPELLYLDCARFVLQRRYSETRRRHPLAPQESAIVGIDREGDLLQPIRDRSDTLIDTSELSVHGLRERLEHQFAAHGKMPLAVTLTSFSYKRGLPQGADIVHDCRFLKNPYWDEDLRGATGLDAAVGRYISSDESFDQFFETLLNFTLFLLPSYQKEGKAHLCIALGCTGGQHRSVYVTEKLSQALAEHNWQVAIRHRELDRINHSESQAQKGL
ncbi:MAG: RNase adapter RapZ [Cognatishimia sp.]|uniref:RNase adapter RapZ n=1 Tax=Cognatishimia sp. TaxID=2211648 RepID=UPI0040590A8C